MDLALAQTDKENKIRGFHSGVDEHCHFDCHSASTGKLI